MARGSRIQDCLLVLWSRHSLTDGDIEHIFLNLFGLELVQIDKGIKSNDQNRLRKTAQFTT